MISQWWPGAPSLPQTWRSLTPTCCRFCQRKAGFDDTSDLVKGVKTLVGWGDAVRQIVHVPLTVRVFSRAS